MAALVNIRDKALELGADPVDFSLDLEAVKADKARELNLGYPGAEIGQGAASNPFVSHYTGDAYTLSEGTRQHPAAQSTQHADS